MQVKDIMTKDVVSVASDTKIIEVAKIIAEQKFRGVPVLENGLVAGMITENDFLTHDFSKIHIPSLIKILGDLKIEKYMPENGNDLKEILDADAESIMSTNFVSIHPDAKVLDLVKIFREKDVNPIPVIDESKHLVGIVSKSDILTLIGSFREEEIDFLSEK